MKGNASILDNINRYVELTPSDEQQILSRLQTTQVRKRQLIVQPGFVCTHQTFVVRGALRAYLLDTDGVEHTLQFAIEDWFISDFNSYITQTPASLFVQAIEDSELFQLHYDAAEELCSMNPKFEHFFRVVAQKSFAFSQRRILSNLGKTAEERYLEFKALYPEIVRRVPQYALASYLGMTPEFLSKIRRKRARKG